MNTIPAKTELTVLPGEPTARKTIGWTCYEVMGTDVYLIPEGQEPSLDLVQDGNLITGETDLKPGMNLLIHDLFGWCHGIVQTDGRSCLSLSGKTLFFLEFATDRPAPKPPRWVCIGSGNLAAIKKMEITR